MRAAPSSPSRIRLLVIALCALALGVVVPPLASADADPEPLAGCGPETVGSGEGASVMLGAVYAGARHLYEFLGAPGACFVCDILVHVVALIEDVGGGAFALLSAPMLGLLVAGGAILLALRAARQTLGLNAGQARAGWQDQAGIATRIVIAGLLLGGTTLGAGAEAVYDTLYEAFIGPAISVSVTAGTALFGAIGASGGGGPSILFTEAEAQTSAYLDDARSRLGADVVDDGVVRAMLRLALALHLLARLGLAHSIGFIADGAQVGSMFNVNAWIGGGIGVLLLTMFVVFIVTVGIRLLDPLLRLALVLALAPVLVVAWVMPPFRQAAVTGLRIFAYACVYCLVAGVVFLVGFELVMLSHGLETPAASYEAHAASLLCSGDTLRPVGDTGEFRVDVGMALKTLVALIIAQGLISQVGVLAGMLTDYRPDGGIAQAAEGQVRGMTSKGLFLMGYAALSLGKGAGAALARGVRSLAGR